MATVKNIKRDMCDDVYGGLIGMKKNLMAMRDDLVRGGGVEKKVVELFDRHLGELMDQIDWKIQILSHACPYDWKGSAADEYSDNTVSVGPAEKTSIDFSGGYLGG